MIEPTKEQLAKALREHPSWGHAYAAEKARADGLEEQFDTQRRALQEAEHALKRIVDGAMSNPPQRVAAFAREAQDNAHAALSNPSSGLPEPSPVNAGGESGASSPAKRPM